MRILHVVPGLHEKWNGIAVAARLIAREQGGELIDCSDCSIARLRGHDEVWVHSMWLPQTMRACWKVHRLKGSNLHSATTTSDYNSSPRLVRMTHANLDPLRYCYHGWKKRLVAPIERWLFKHTDRLVVTCEAEKEWCQQWGLENEFEMVDLKKFFDLGGGEGLGRRPRSTVEDSLHVLYLGRRHPLKGVEFLERAVAELNQSFEHSEHSNNRTIELRIVSDHFGEELEKDWAWCDVLVLSTLSENFGLVVAEALERGKKAITTDGAPAWEPPGAAEVKVRGEGEQWWDRIIYLKGYRDGTDEERVRLLKEAVRSLV